MNYKKYQQFCRDCDAGKYPNQRFGQAFINLIKESEIEVPANLTISLFYGEDRKIAEMVILNNYIKWEDQNVV